MADEQNVLDQALADAINKSNDGIEQAVDFVIAQTPELIDQALTWNVTISAIYMALWIGTVIAIIWVNKKQYRYFVDVDEGMTDDKYIFNVFQIFWMIPLVKLFSFDWLKIWIAPKVWLIEYARSLAG